MFSSQLELNPGKFNLFGMVVPNRRRQSKVELVNKLYYLTVHALSACSLNFNKIEN